MADNSPWAVLEGLPSARSVLPASPREKNSPPFMLVVPLETR
jgi:hypothetical protein